MKEVDVRKNPWRLYFVLLAITTVMGSIGFYASESLGFTDKENLGHFIFRVAFWSIGTSAGIWYFNHYRKAKREDNVKAAAPSANS